MNKEQVLGIDLGGTNVRVGLVADNALQKLVSQPVLAQGTERQVFDQICNLADQLITSATTAIGIGVPGLVDMHEKMVYDVVNIPSWKKVPLQQWLEEKYKRPVFVNNDANCFALGEYHFKQGSNYTSMVGLTIGTGLGAGIVINGSLYNGNNCGAGEFGMISYLDHDYEYYASGRFFTNVYGTNGEAVYRLAREGNEEARSKYHEMGAHLGNALKMILYAYDPQCIVLGGSVSKAFDLFEKGMLNSLQTFAFQPSLSRLQLQVSSLENSGVLGAAALCFTP